MPLDNQQSLREHVVALLTKEQAHMSFDHAITAFPTKLRGATVSGLPHTAWQLLEHLRIAQWDMVDFTINKKYKEITWPDDYWPKRTAPKSAAEWNSSIARIRRDLNVMVKLVANPKTDLYSVIPWGSGQTILREALVIADHNAYHVAQLVDVRKALGAWPPGKG